MYCSVYNARPNQRGAPSSQSSAMTISVAESAASILATTTSRRGVKISPAVPRGGGSPITLPLDGSNASNLERRYRCGFSDAAPAARVSCRRWAGASAEAIRACGPGTAPPAPPASFHCPLPAHHHPPLRAFTTRHCERSEAIQKAHARMLDCFVARLLAMTQGTIVACLGRPGPAAASSPVIARARHRSPARPTNRSSPIRVVIGHARRRVFAAGQHGHNRPRRLASSLNLGSITDELWQASSAPGTAAASRSRPPSGPAALLRKRMPRRRAPRPTKPHR